MRLLDEEVFAQGGNGAIVSKFFAEVVVAGRFGENFYDEGGIGDDGLILALINGLVANHHEVGIGVKAIAIDP